MKEVSRAMAIPPFHYFVGSLSALNPYQPRLSTSLGPTTFTLA